EHVYRFRNPAQFEGSQTFADIGVDVVLHLGEVFYGNIGARGRLDFTVIGSAVNEASRLEKLCSKLGHHLLISESFARTSAVA
ncbi:hypothetical protein ACC710_37290, partial [Rhizobium ruizarguesonis]